MEDIANDDGTFDKQRERVDTPMRRLFETYGRDDWSSLFVGLLGGIGAHAFGVVPPYLLGVAIDGIFGNKAFSLRFVPDAWLRPLPTSSSGWSRASSAPHTCWRRSVPGSWASG